MLSKLLVKTFIKDYPNTDSPVIRGKYGYLSGIVGIIANVVLFAVKFITGFMINSIAFIGDAFNNLTDAASSLVTIIGFKIANKPADPEHPFGHGRLEYIAGLIVSFLVLLVGYELLKSSIDRIINPVPVHFKLSAFLILVLAIALKAWLYFFNRYLSKEINSKALHATAYDSLSDMIATGCIALSFLASLVTPFPFDGYVGVIVAAIILYSGITLIKETISPLLGEIPDQELIDKISQMIKSYEKVVGIHDLIVHSYGPGKYMASIHVEISANEDVMAMHEYIDTIEREVSVELGLILTIHMDPLNTDSEERNRLHEEIDRIVLDIPGVLDWHDFRIVGKGLKENLIFDVVLEHKIIVEEEKEIRRTIVSRVREKHPHYHCIITFDRNDMLVSKS